MNVWMRGAGAATLALTLWQHCGHATAQAPASDSAVTTPLQYAKYVAEHRLGPRNASNAPARADKAAPAPHGAKALDGPSESIEVPLSANPTAEEMRERVLRKYTSGLR